MKTCLKIFIGWHVHTAKKMKGRAPASPSRGGGAESKKLDMHKTKKHSREEMKLGLLSDERTRRSSSLQIITALQNFLFLISYFLFLPWLSAAEPANLLPNGTFTATPPLKGWITTFPDEAWYKENGKYLRIDPEKSRPKLPALVMDLPPGLAGNQGGKIESFPVKVIPGATYRVAVDCMTWDFTAKLHAEAWTPDPQPEQKRTLFRKAPHEGLPALMMCYRAQLPDPPGHGKTWSTVEREFTVPKTVRVAGKDQAPQYITVKAVAYAGTMKAGKSYFSNFRLTLVKEP